MIPCQGQEDHQQKPKTSNIEFSEALDEFKKKNYAESAKICQEIIKKSPDNIEAMNLYGSILMKSREFKQARELYAKAYKLKPHYSLQFNLAEIDFVQKNWLEAEKGFNQLLSNTEASDSIKSVARFKLLIVALENNDQKSLETHKLFFEDSKMNRELDFFVFAQKIKNEKLSIEEAGELSKPLQRKYTETAPLIDSILEIYFEESMAK